MFRPLYMYIRYITGFSGFFTAVPHTCFALSIAIDNINTPVNCMSIHDVRHRSTVCHKNSFWSIQSVNRAHKLC